MCRHKPGPRCYPHALTGHKSAIRRLTAAKDAHKKAFPGSPAAEAAATKLAKAVRTAEHATFDLDATRTQQQALTAALANDALTFRQRQGLVARQEAGIGLREARKKQVKAMPPPPAVLAAAGASRLYDNIGSTREQIAYVDARLVHASGDARERLLVARGVLDTDALGLEVAYRVRAADGLPDLGHLSAVERDGALTGAEPVRKAAAYLSHLRATAAHHPGRLDSQVAERTAALAALLAV